MAINLILLICLLGAGLWTVMTTRLIRAVVGLALTSAVLSIVMFQLDSPLAAVFELSVCAGLISVIFLTTVNFTERLTPEQMVVRRKERLAKFRLLPFFIVIVGILLYFCTKPVNFPALHAIKEVDVRDMLWNTRRLDLMGQIAALLAAAVGVIILFREQKK